MNCLTIKTLPILVCTILGTLSTITAFGQAAKVVGDKPSFDDIQSPDFSVGKSKNFKAKDWLEIEAKLKISLSPEPRSKTCDKITVKWYIAVKNPENAKQLLLLTKSIDHVNLPLDQDIYCSVYLSPASIKRITGFDRAAKSSVESVGYEVLINGEKMVQESSKGQPGWWNLATDKFSRSETVPLLNKTETPFSFMWWDRYAEVSVERR